MSVSVYIICVCPDFTHQSAFLSFSHYLFIIHCLFIIYCKDDCLAISAKTGEGVSSILPQIVNKVPPPNGKTVAPCRARVVDSWFDDHRGVICLIQVSREIESSEWLVEREMDWLRDREWIVAR